MGRNAETCSLAMLDETGVVVSWYGHGDADGGGNEHVVDHHVSQFYLPEEIATSQPLRDLHSAKIAGRTTRQGWRRQPDGTTVWCTVVIEAVVLRDGRLQGFSYATGSCDAPSADVPVAQSLSSPQDGDSRRSVSLVAPALLLAFATSLLFASSLAFAAPPSALPEHAREGRYGNGWDCMNGFRRVGDTCAHIVVPANAYLEPSGRSWRCDRGYLNARDRCVAVQVPENAYLDDATGTGWRCDRDYREANGACVAVQIPVNARSSASSYGSGWECKRGFRVEGGQCLAVVIPARGFLGSSGDTWECERGFAKEGMACLAVQLPANAHFDYSGNDWACDDGFHKRRSLCEGD